MFEIFILLVIFSLDTLFVSISYSIKNIKISLKSTLLISLICLFSLLISLFITNNFKHILNQDIGKIISSIILLILGLYNLFQNKIKKNLKSKNKIIEIYLDETKADLDNSKNISYKEALLLSTILSLDSLLGGVSIGFMKYNLFYIIILSFILNVLFILCGIFIGKNLRNVYNFNTSYISGAILLLIAILKII